MNHLNYYLKKLYTQKYIHKAENKAVTQLKEDGIFIDGLCLYLWNLDAACRFVLDWDPSSSSPSVSLSSESSWFQGKEQNNKQFHNTSVKL